MREYVFVKASHDYADEFDVVSCFVILKSDFDKKVAVIQQAFENGDISEHSGFYFGNNEYMSFESFEVFKGGLTVSPCTEAFADEFHRINPSGIVGYSVFDRLYKRAQK